jgi:hypothetical protein
MSLRFCFGVGVLLPVFLGDGVTLAVSETVAVTPKVISRQDGDARVLLRPSDLSFLEGKLVTGARLEIDLPARTPSESLDLKIYAISRSWDASASWDTPWQEPGGDWSLDYFNTARLTEGRAASRVRFDVSSIVRSFADGDAANHGFILMPAGHHNGGRFRSEDLELLGDDPEVTLTVSYRRLRGARSGT